MPPRISHCYILAVAPATFYRPIWNPAATRPLPVTPRLEEAMPSSVRARLTMWHAGAVTCVLLILASTTYWLLRHDSIHRIDSSLEDVTNSFLATVQAELRDAREAETFKDCVASAIQEHTYRETTFSVFDQQGNLVMTSP